MTMKKPRIKWNHERQCWYLLERFGTSQYETTYSVYVLTLHIKKGRIPTIDNVRGTTEDWLKSHSHINFSRR